MAYHTFCWASAMKQLSVLFQIIKDNMADIQKKVGENK